MLVLILSALTLAACSSADGDAEPSAMAMTDEGHDDEHKLDATGAHEIELTVTEFTFAPDEIRVHAGSTIKLVFKNEGTVLHDISSMDFVGEAEAIGEMDMDHDTTMEGMADMVFHISAEPQHSGKLLFVASKAGTYELFCSVPGHKELGMVATLAAAGAGRGPAARPRQRCDPRLGRILGGGYRGLPRSGHDSLGHVGRIAK
jgi:uncharacterized cupredoxin-like copper-binding protein